MDADLALHRLFGPIAEEYLQLTCVVLDRAKVIQYCFISDDIWKDWHAKGRLTADETNKIIAFEILMHAHLAAVASLARSQRWMTATARGYEECNYLAWAAGLRGLIEATGDAMHSLGPIAHYLAWNLSLLDGCLAGRCDGILNATPLEDLLIHFTQARMLDKDEKRSVPKSHEAQSAAGYAREVEGAGLKGAKQLYDQLCRVTHPAKASIDFMYDRDSSGKFCVSLSNDRRAMDEVISSHSDVLEGLPSLTFNPALLTLRVLQKFKAFPRQPEMRKFNFQNAPAWQKLKPLLR